MRPWFEFRTFVIANAGARRSALIIRHELHGSARIEINGSSDRSVRDGDWRFSEYCHIRNGNLRSAHTSSGTTRRVAFLTLKVHCLPASQHGSVSWVGSFSPPWLDIRSSESPTLSHPAFEPLTEHLTQARACSAERGSADTLGMRRRC